MRRARSGQRGGGRRRSRPGGGRRRVRCRRHGRRRAPAVSARSRTRCQVASSQPIERPSRGRGRVATTPRGEPRIHRLEALAGALVGVGDDPLLARREARPAPIRLAVDEPRDRVAGDRPRQLRVAVPGEPGRRALAVRQGTAPGRTRAGPCPRRAAAPPTPRAADPATIPAASIRAARNAATSATARACRTNQVGGSRESRREAASTRRGTVIDRMVPDGRRGTRPVRRPCGLEGAGRSTWRRLAFRDEGRDRDRAAKGGGRRSGRLPDAPVGAWCPWAGPVAPCRRRSSLRPGPRCPSA